MRILGIDFGEKRIGIAISDPLGLTAQAVAVIGKGEDFKQDINELKKIIKKYDGVDEIVVGLPKTMAGEIGKQAQKVLGFVEALKGSFKININTWDERLTTVEAEKTLISAGLSREKRKKVIDKSAATYILQSYLDRKRK
ncbi:Holliday junction resolvase [candidate division WOR-1 bacterium DG_54_3]|uniref:Putative pre-16S rRNA nuclease n=1 Tax=candidate division WOR-1 bacterium DG_54_3 TaxID=1703775 RepID=A0A0S7XTN5_UNCSA|nr:MAG: Holliday junction resolvase [candidate division WOR-1 bacterium DG_54_3]